MVPVEDAPAVTPTRAPAERPFRLDLRRPPLVGPVVAGVLERALALDRLNRVYAEVSRDGDFVEACLTALRVQVSVAADDLARVPAEGPVLVVANHPFGGVEGLALAALLRRRRRDVRIVANRLLACLPETRDLFFFFDAFGGPHAARENVAALRAAMRHLASGGLLALFPAGTVAHATLLAPRASDPHWNANVGGLVRRTGASVVPVFFEGANGPLFQAAGLLHASLRTALLPRELLNKGQRVLRARVGGPIRAPVALACGDDSAVTAHLRHRTEALRLARRSASADARRAAPSAAAVPVAAARPPEELAAELAHLPAERTLVADANYRVVLFRGAECPAALHAIGRAREIAFRTAGEGTGLALDLDRFDDVYEHLLLLDERSGGVAGAYRVARTDEVLRASGPHGLYLRTLFDLDERFLARVGPALELGRSFVAPEHQRSFSPLTMLWRGIGAYVARQPRYRTLVGPVSMSGSYTGLARALVAAWLERHAGDPALAGVVRALNPPRHRPDVRRLAQRLAGDLADVGDLSACVADLEDDGRGVPVLVREYLKLGGRFVAFNVDPAFSDCLDGLVVVDLLRTRRRILERYLGAPGAARFLELHGGGAPSPTEEATSTRS